MYVYTMYKIVHVHKKYIYMNYIYNLTSFQDGVAEIFHDSNEKESLEVRSQDSNVRKYL